MKKLKWLLRQWDNKMSPTNFVEKNFENYSAMYCERNNLNNDWWEISWVIYDRVYLFATENARKDMTTLYNMWLDDFLFDNNITSNE